MSNNILAALPVFQSGYRLFDGSDLNQLANAMRASVAWPGNIYYVDPSQAGNGVGTINSPFNSLTAGYNRAVAGNNDIVVLVGNGGTTASARLATTLDWAKNATHLVGVTAPVQEAQRARITTVTGATVNVNPLMTVSASGCIFSNFSFFQGIGQSATDEQLINITGSRNYFGNVQFGGMGAAAGAARAGSYNILLSGGGENLFDRCSIGLETIQRSAANANVRVRSGAQRNQFWDCEFVMAASATSPLYLDVNASNALNGSTLVMRRCLLRNLLNISSAATPAVAITVAADANGTIVVDSCKAMATDWSAASTLVQLINGAADAQAGGLAIAAT